MQALRAIELEEFRGSEIARQTQPQTHLIAFTPVSTQKLKNLGLEVQKACLNRGESLDPVRLESYSKALAEDFGDDAEVLAVLNRLGRTERAEYEPIIPPLATLLKAVREFKETKAREANPYVPCGHCCSGMVIVETMQGSVAQRCQCWIDWKYGEGR